MSQVDICPCHHYQSWYWPNLDQIFFGTQFWWTQILLDLKFLLAQQFLENKNWSDTKFYWTSKNVWTQNCCTHNIFGSKIFLDPKYFRTKNLFATQILLDLKSCWTQNLFGTKIFLDPKSFWTQNLFEPNFFFKVFSLNTFHLSLVWETHTNLKVHLL